eukprot:8870-Prorocentrum_minimum.AAC.2
MDPSVRQNRGGPPPPTRGWGAHGGEGVPGTFGKTASNIAWANDLPEYGILGAVEILEIASCGSSVREANLDKFPPGVVFLQF